MNQSRMDLLYSESCSVVSDSLRSHELYSPWDSPGQNTGVSSLSLLQGIFPTQGSNPGLWHCRQVLYKLSHKGKSKNLQTSLSQATAKTQDCLFLIILIRFYGAEVFKSHDCVEAKSQNDLAIHLESFIETCHRSIFFQALNLHIATYFIVQCSNFLCYLQGWHP